MLEIFLYAVGIMYTPGPVNLLGLNAGLQNRFWQTRGFFLGVGLAMLIFFLAFGYTGEAVIKQNHLPCITLAGAAFISYLAVRLLIARPRHDKTPTAATLRFRDGLLMQLLNPKAFLATLPIATVQYPAHGITGPGILGVSLLLSLLAVGAPGSYSLSGALAGRWITGRRGGVGVTFNRLTALLLLYVAASMLYSQVYRPHVGG